MKGKDKVANTINNSSQSTGLLNCKPPTFASASGINPEYSIDSTNIRRRRMPIALAESQNHLAVIGVSFV